MLLRQLFLGLLNVVFFFEKMMWSSDRVRKRKRDARCRPISNFIHVFSCLHTHTLNNHMQSYTNWKSPTVRLFFPGQFRLHVNRTEAWSICMMPNCLQQVQVMPIIISVSHKIIQFIVTSCMCPYSIWECIKTDVNGRILTPSWHLDLFISRGQSLICWRKLPLQCHTMQL